MEPRASGVLLHPTCLPGEHGSGDLGPQARAFVDFLSSAGQRWWQMLPVAPPGYGESPYSAESAFAGSPLLISLGGLVDMGLLEADAIAPAEPLPRDHVDYVRMQAHRMRHLQAAFWVFEASGPCPAFDAFCADNSGWLDDFALYRALKREHGGVQWTRWPRGERDRDPEALESARQRHAHGIAFERFLQYAVRRPVAGASRVRQRVAASGWSAICPSSWLTTAPTSGSTASTSSSMRAASPRSSRAARPTTSARRASGGAIPSIAGAACARPDTAGGSPGSARPCSGSTSVRLDHFIGFQRYWEIPRDRADRHQGPLDEGPRAPTSSMPSSVGAGRPAAHRGGSGRGDPGRVRAPRPLRAAGDPHPPVRLRRRPVGARRSCRTTTPGARSSTRARTTTTPSSGGSTSSWPGPEATRRGPPSRSDRERETVLRYLGDGRRGDSLEDDPPRHGLGGATLHRSPCRTSWAWGRRRG